MLWGTVTECSTGENNWKPRQDKNQPPHTETLSRQEATSQRSDISIHVACQPFFSRDWMCCRGSHLRLDFPGSRPAPGVFVAACKVYFLSNCKQTIAKISIETARLRETPAGTEAYGWIIYDDFVVLLLVSEVCVTCIYESESGFIRLVKLAIGVTWALSRRRKSTTANTSVHGLVPDHSTRDIQFAKFQSKTFSAPLRVKEPNGLFFSSDNKGKQLLQAEKPSWRYNIWNVGTMALTKFLSSPKMSCGTQVSNLALIKKARNSCLAGGLFIQNISNIC